MQWLTPWWHVAVKSPDTARALERELARELTPGHVLYGVAVAAIGKHDACDDALFELRDGSGRVAVVHLTWTGKPETAAWPVTELFAGFAAFCTERMEPEHAEHTAEGEAES